MPLFLPKLMIDKMTDLDESFFTSIGCKAVILDVDNTLTTHDNPVPAEGVEQWLGRMKKFGLSFIIVSNNSEERVKPFARLIDVDFVSKGAKPMKKGYKEALRRLGTAPSETVTIGDQIFTDIMGGNLAGVYTVLTVPYEYEKTKFFKFKRFMEKPFIAAYKRRREKNK